MSKAIQGETGKRLAVPMRGDNRTFEVVMLPEYIRSIRTYAKGLGLTLNDFNVLIGILKLSKHQAAEQPTTANDRSLTTYLSVNRASMLNCIGRLTAEGLVIREDHGRRGTGQYHTYVLTRAGRNAIDAYYEEHYR